MKVVVVIPTYNERQNIGPLVERISQIHATLPDRRVHILFVDDGSPDGTASEVERLAADHEHIHLLERPEKKGIGTAYLDGFREAIAKIDPSVFVQMDADLQHPPERIVDLVTALGDSDVALGSRYVPGGGIEGWSWTRRLVSRGANWLARVVLGLSVKDATTGFKALNRRSVDLLVGVSLSSSGFIYQVESIFLFERNGLRIKEIPFLFKERSRGESKLSLEEIFEFLVRIIGIRMKGSKEFGG
ncbi:MAG: polyprenol monophosphomannose synthase [Thaumarchaeota archaeon]|nr:polyprenol monophosphomannose synthase [Nitrososphaerota archaeon]